MTNPDEEKAAVSDSKQIGFLQNCVSAVLSNRVVNTVEETTGGKCRDVMCMCGCVSSGSWEEPHFSMLFMCE